MKNMRIVALLLCLALLAGCAPAVVPEESASSAPTATEEPMPTATPEASAPATEPATAADLYEQGKTMVARPALLPMEDYPAVDGSTACLPLMARVMADVTGISLEEAEAVVSASRTAAAYDALLDETADLLLVYEAPEETKARIEAGPVEIECTPIGTDALVFITNTANPVDSLTRQQLVDIYTGKITNWKELGGEDAEIVAFQRNAESGSQALFLKLLMQGTKPMEAPTERFADGMSGLIDVLAQYNNAGNAIGYSVYYYASEMYAVDGLKMLAVDGVHPNAETLASGEYPLLNQFYVATRKGVEDGSPVAVLRDYILSEDGRAAIAGSGYVALAGE